MKKKPATSHQPPAASKPKVALVADWLTNMGGAEPTVLALHKQFPHAPIYTSVFDAERMPAFADCDVRTTYLQKFLPKFVRYKHALWPVLRAFAFRRLNLKKYDLIISSASAEAKAVQKHPDAIHICYCHTPIRYYWSHYEEFKRDFSFGPLTFLIRPLIPVFVRWMRRKDIASIPGVDYFIANSNETKRRIRQYYGRESTVIFPPVAVERFAKKPNGANARRGYIVWGRHVPYKRFDLAIEACNRLRVPLTIAGSGPETKRLERLAGPTIQFVGRVSDAELVRLAHSHKAFLFPTEEDFGIAPIEAMAAGLPVIALKKGGALDYVIEGKTGVFFAQQTISSLIAAIEQFETLQFSTKTLQTHAQQFSAVRFQKQMQEFVAAAEAAGHSAAAIDTSRNSL